VNTHIKIYLFLLRKKELSYKLLKLDWVYLMIWSYYSRSIGRRPTGNNEIERFEISGRYGWFCL